MPENFEKSFVSGRNITSRIFDILSVKNLVKISIYSSLVTPLWITLSCSSAAKKQDEKIEVSSSLLSAFNKAKSLEITDRKESCQIFARLSREEFPLKNLSLLHSYRVCEGADKMSLSKVSDDLLKTEPWLAKLEYERQLQIAEESKDDSLLAQVYFQMARRSDRTREKLELLQRALKTNSQIADPKIEDIERIKSIKERIYKLAPRLNPQPPPEEYLAVGQDWLFQRNFDKGREYLEKFYKNPRTSLNDQYLARRAYRNSFKTEQRKEDYIKEARNLALWTLKNANQQRIQEAYVTLARAEWTQGNASACLRILKELEKVVKENPSAMSEISFIRARVAEEAKNYKLSLQELDRSLNTTKTQIKSQLSFRTLFQKAWLQRKLGNYAEAADSFQKLLSYSDDPTDRNKSQFWRAKSLKQSGQDPEALEVFEQLKKEDPLGYYGLMAFKETGEAFPALQNQKTPEENSQAIIPGEHSQKYHDLITALLFVDESDILKSLLDFIMDKQKDVAQFNAQDWMYYLKVFAKAGLYQPLFQRITQMPPATKSSILAQNPDLLFPRRFFDIIKSAGKKFSVSPELMLSIIRQESSFDPYARSIADAMGLMQVLPMVADQQFPRTKIKLEHHEDLYKPEINVPIGASLLSELNQKYRGQFLLVAAAYNANEKSIQGWLNTRLGEDPLEFIEDIPFEETRGYVKLVLRNFIFYSRLNEPAKTMSFPMWCLEDLQSFKLSTK